MPKEHHMTQNIKETINILGSSVHLHFIIVKKNTIKNIMLIISSEACMMCLNRLNHDIFSVISFVVSSSKSMFFLNIYHV